MALNANSTNKSLAKLRSQPLVKAIDVVAADGVEIFRGYDTSDNFALAREMLENAAVHLAGGSELLLMKTDRWSYMNCTLGSKYFDKMKSGPFNPRTRRMSTATLANEMVGIGEVSPLPIRMLRSSVFAMDDMDEGCTQMGKRLWRQFTRQLKKRQRSHGNGNAESIVREDEASDDAEYENDEPGLPAMKKRVHGQGNGGCKASFDELRSYELRSLQYHRVDGCMKKGKCDAVKDDAIKERMKAKKTRTAKGLLTLKMTMRACTCNCYRPGVLSFRTKSVVAVEGNKLNAFIRCPNYGVACAGKVLWCLVCGVVLVE